MFTIFIATKSNLVHNVLSLSLIPQDGWTALMYASWYNYLKVVEKLLQECAHPDHQSNVSN